MKIACIQIHNSLGDLKAASQKIQSLIHEHGKSTDLMLVPEGGLASYFPGDFLYLDAFFKAQQKELEKIHKILPKNLALLLPAFFKKEKKLYNGCYLLIKGKEPRFFIKEFLAKDTVFYEHRYFQKGSVKDNVFKWKNKKIQILICEDFWKVQKLQANDLVVVLNASPYTENKNKARLKKALEINKVSKKPLVYLNRCGTQDELIFDGRSFAIDSKGQKIWQGKAFESDFKIVDLNCKKTITKQKNLNLHEEWEQAITLGIRDFIKPLPFSEVMLGLSGGIDSALTLYFCVQALGSKKVKAYFLPSLYTQKRSYKIAHQLTKTLEVDLLEQDISDIYSQLKNFTFQKQAKSIGLQNLQSRLRLMFLMGQSNEHSRLLIGTSNKSEIATGYGTLYGDLSGALLPLGDLWKTEIYELAFYLNKKYQVFSKDLLTRPPSAELARGQEDEKDLMPYKKLDSILQKLIQGQPASTYEQKRIQNLLRANEFKRKQAPPILKLKNISFGSGWKMPISHNFSF